MDTLTDIRELTINDLVKKAVEFQQAIEELDAGLKVCKDEIGQRLTEMKVTGTKVDNYFVARVRRVSFPDVLLSQATELGAVHMSIDMLKLRKLWDKGIKLPAKITEFVVIKAKETA